MVLIVPAEDRHTRITRRSLANNSRKTSVDNDGVFDSAVEGTNNVCELDVAMHDSPIMYSEQGICLWVQ